MWFVLDELGFSVDSQIVRLNTPTKDNEVWIHGILLNK